MILASRSPRRKDLLRVIVSRFAVRPAHVDETPLPHETPESLATRLAKDKALAIARALNPGLARSRAVVIGSDTIVALGDLVLGKPGDDSEARRMLRLLSGRTHRVVTGVAVWSGAERKVRAGRRVTRVVFRKLSAAEIRDYVATGEPADAAGAYQIQGGAARFVLRVDGSYSNVVGLPLDLTARLLARS
ncbi:MAG: septum formation protein Maf [Acidobacteria bacterium]|nr:septum formation protein Maf [Acidobacteriota bacterium]